MDHAARRETLQSGGFSEAQANAFALAMADFATNDRLDHRCDQLRSDILQLHRDLTNLWWKLAVILFVQTGLVVSLIKLI